MRFKVFCTTLISTLCLTLVSFASEKVDESDYKSYIYSGIENILSVPRSEIVKDNKSIEKINSYIKNSIDLGISLDEFKVNVNKELSEFKNDYQKPLSYKIFMLVLYLFIASLVIYLAIMLILYLLNIIKI